MTKYHINGEGNPGVCSAESGNCPFGGDANHYSTKEKAREAFELSMAAQALLKRTTKRSSSAEAIAGALAERSLREFAVFARGGWNPTNHPADFERETHAKLLELSESTTVGNMFERASQLKKNYDSWYYANETADVIDPEDLSRDTYLHMVAPATTAAVTTVENTLADLDWTTRNSSDDADTNHRVFSEILRLDMSTAAGPHRAVELLKENGWIIDEADAADELKDAVVKGQEKALTYGARFQYEQTHLL